MTISFAAVFLAKNTRLPRQKCSQAECQQTLDRLKNTHTGRLKNGFSLFSDGLCRIAPPANPP
ncbi:hypothetical protein HMPREF9123_1720 [Neisseria bacilliformis ATCC BAA-1200]|uniref:Uncharacterized protein n=1 Tax=Neisseria bacilliformis ATCC BAA-1200 TaxID=888742 RepID=F2BDB4_9NEIS|nr:hypothetical protein HMPREF9123_1720 [Neisseria bacilliformis ATCC BAA-1200]